MFRRAALLQKQVQKKNTEFTGGQEYLQDTIFMKFYLFSLKKKKTGRCPCLQIHNMNNKEGKRICKLKEEKKKKKV